MRFFIPLFLSLLVGRCVTYNYLHPDEVNTTLKQRRVQIRKCHDIRRKAKKSKKGKIVVGFSISPNGRVRSYKVIQDTIENKELTRCLVRVLRSTHFRETKGETEVASYTIYENRID